jgi:hypothetical protein
MEKLALKHVRLGLYPFSMTYDGVKYNVYRSVIQPDTGGGLGIPYYSDLGFMWGVINLCNDSLSPPCTVAHQNCAFSIMTAIQVIKLQAIGELLCK